MTDGINFEILNKHLSELQKLVEEAVDYALERTSKSLGRITYSDLPQLFEVCRNLLTSGGEYTQDKLTDKYLEFYKLYKSRIMEKAWYILWSLLEESGVRVKTIYIADRMGGEGTSFAQESGRTIGRDIDMLVVVYKESYNKHSKKVAKRVEQQMNEAVLNAINNILEEHKVDHELLTLCKVNGLFEVELFKSDEEAKKWSYLYQYTRDDFVKQRTKRTSLLPPKT